MRKRKEEARASGREREKDCHAKTYYTVTIDTAKMREDFPAIFFLLFHPQTGNFAIRGARQTSEREQVLTGLTRNRG